MGKIIRIALLVVGSLTVVVVVLNWAWSFLPPLFDQVGYSLAAALLGVVAFLAGLNEVIELVQKFFPGEPQIIGVVIEPEPEKKHLDQTQVEFMLRNRAVVDHDRLYGIDKRLQDINMCLADTNDSWIISLFGDGGIGKTALAYEAVKQFAVQDGFTRVAWVSAKQRYLTVGAESVQSTETETRWTDLVRQVAKQLDIELGLSQSTWLDDFREGIRKLPNHEKCLIVVDNLETVEDAGVISYFDNPLPGKRIVSPHKVLITTRKSVAGEASGVREIRVTELDTTSGLAFIRDLGRTNTAIMTATDTELHPILVVTEGNPLLIKLVVRRVLQTKKPLSNVLSELKQIGAEIGLGHEVRDFLYLQSLKALEDQVGMDVAKKLMNAFCPSAAGDQLDYDTLKEYSQIEDPQVFDEARSLACSLSLIRVSGTVTQSRYSIHSLLWGYTCRQATQHA